MTTIKSSCTGILVSNYNPHFIEQSNKLTMINVGSVFTINDKKYILSCHHCIKNSYNNIFNKQYECSLVCMSAELELGLLSIETDNIECNLLSDFDLTLNSFRNTTKFNIETCDIDSYVKTKICILENINCTFYDIIYSNHLSLNMPKMPFIRVTLNNTYTDISQLSGISGSIVRSGTNAIIGIVSSIIDSYVYIIPSYCILKFLNEFKSTNHFNGISGLVGQFNLCAFDQNELRSNLPYGILVSNTYGIKSNLLKNDIILEVGGQPIDGNGKIYDKVIKLSLEFNLYFSLNYPCGETVILKIARLKKGSNTEYKEKNITIESRSLNSMKYIPIEFNKKIFEFANMKFIELSEDIINHYLNLGINTGLSVADKYIDNPYRHTENFIVILTDIDKTKLVSRLRKTVTNIGLPLVPIKNKQYSFTIIKKINSNKITCLDDFVKYTNQEGHNEIIIDAIIDSFGKIVIHVKNGDIVNIVKGK